MIVDSMNAEGHRLLLERSTPAHDSARVLFDSALVLAEATFGPIDLGVAKSLVGLAHCDHFTKDRNQTEPALKRAIEIYRAVWGENHEMVASILRLLGDHYVVAMNYQQAEQTYLLARQILGELPEADIHNAYTKPLILNNLALLYMKTHRLEEAEPLLLEAVSAWQAAFGPDSYWMGLAYESLASVYMGQSRLEEAEPLLLKALSLLERTRGEEDMMVAECLGLLGKLYINLGEYEQAVKAGERQLHIWEVTFGTQHWYVNEALRSLATSEKYLGNWDNVKEYNDRRLRIAEDWGNTKSMYSTDALIDNAKVYYMRGQTDSCLSAYSRAMAIRQERVDVLFKYASEAQKLGFGGDYPLIVDSYLSFAQRDGSDMAVNGALDAILHGKSLILDAIAAEREIAYCVEDTSIVQMVEQHSNVCGQIARLWLDEEKQAREGGTKDTIDALISVKDRLEAELSARCADFQDELAQSDFAVSDISEALPDGSTLIEYVSYTPFKFERIPRKANWEDSVYAAFVLTGSNDVTMIDLGEVSHIDSMVLEYRELMNKASYQVYQGKEAALETELSAVTSDLYRLVFAPLEEFIEVGPVLFISPYGMLNLLPFGLLATDDERYLIEKYNISYLSSGRDLLKARSRDLPVGNRALVIADPDYTT
jgi:tetratricopeptide (TPR) repeat protein